MGIIAEQEKVRKFHPSDAEIYDAEMAGINILLDRQIPESDIQEFCKGCDLLKSDGVCPILGSNNQARYVEKKWCGWARVNGEEKQKTSEGFKSF